MKMVPLSELAIVNPRPSRAVEEKEDVVFLPMASISEDGKILAQEVRQYGEVKKGFTNFERGDVLLAKITPCFENGKSTIADKLIHPNGFGSTEFHVLRAIPKKAFPNYLYHIVRSRRFRYLGQKLMKGAAGHKRVPQEFVQNFEVPDWSYDNQIRIAHLLGKVERLIAQRKKHLQELDDLVKSVFLDIFGDPILNPNGFPIRKLSDFYINSSEGTKCGPFGSALKKDELVESGVPVWNMDNISTTGKMVHPFRMWIKKEKYDELSAYSVNDGDIIISRAGTVGKMCVARMNGQQAIISTNLIRLRLNAELKPLHFVSLMLYCKGRIGRLKTGADGAFTHMNTGVLDSLEFPFPPMHLQNKFEEIASNIEATKINFSENILELDTLYATISQQVFKGELDLSRVPLPSQPIPDARSSTPISQPAPLVSPIHLPETPLLAKALKFPPNLKALLHFWLKAYCDQLGTGAFSTEHFLDAARARLTEAHPDQDFELGSDAYEHLKTWVFETLASGYLTQKRDETNNRIRLQATRA